jgi:hypothetical protein
MTEQLKLAFLAPEQQTEFVTWVNENSRNAYDPAILGYPTLKVLRSYNSHTIAYLPTHQCLVLESVAMNPHATELEKAQALRDLVKGAELLASSFRLKEIYFIASDEQVKELAERRGFEEVRCMRLKLQ